MSRGGDTWNSLRALFFRKFFHLLLIASSVAMWVVPAWIATVVGGVAIPAAGHFVAVAVVYSFNRALVRGPLRGAGDWLRRYSAVAFVLLLCSVFLVASVSVFGALGFVVGLASTDAGSAVAGASRLWGLSGIVLVSGAMLFGYTGGQRQLGVNRLDVPVRGWTGELRILQLSDIHVGTNLSFEQLEGFVERANRETPDLVCLTGDIADGPHADLETFFPLLGRLRARLGVVAVLGNHDHYAGADRVEAALEANGITVLRDRAMTLDLDGERLHVIGLDDRGLDWARGMPNDGVLARLLEESPERVPQLLLVHRPDVFRHAAESGVALTLSGHTHGGQIALPWFGGRRRNLAEFITPFDRGFFDLDGARLYVNCGLGVTAQRIRLFTPREISVFELRAAGVADVAVGLPEEPLFEGAPEIA